MPRSLQEILEHANELGRRFEEHEATDVRNAAPLHAIREAVTERAAAERRVAETRQVRVRRARQLSATPALTRSRIHQRNARHVVNVLRYM